MIADLWNALKERCETVYSREQRQLSYFEMSGEITVMRRECPEWLTVPAMTASSRPSSRPRRSGIFSQGESWRDSKVSAMEG